MAAATRSQALSPPRVRWRPLLSNAGLAGLFTLFVVSNGASLLEHPRLSIGLLIVFQATIVGLAIVRRDARSTDQSLAAFAAGWAGTVLPLFLRPTASGSDLLIGQSLQVAGLVLQLVAVLSLGRSFGVIAADRGIKTGGAYRFVRHPIYAAYLLADIGFVISHPTLGNVAAISAAAATQVIRIWFEERHLAGNPDYADFCRVQRWRLVPGVW
jgi:protein-S-isoprenylcysteine O-methyltransferase Ste14